MNRRFIGIDISAKYIDMQDPEYLEQPNTFVNILVGKTSHESKKDLDENWDYSKKRNRKIDMSF